MASDESRLTQELDDLQRKLGKKQQFEAAVGSISSILRERYVSASPSLRNSIFQAVTRVSTVLQSRYVAPYFWKTGLNLFEEAEQIVTERTHKESIKKYIAKAREFLQENDNEAPAPPNRQPDNRYLFEGHLTVQPEPPPPAWLVAQQTAMRLEASLGESSNTPETEEVQEQLMSQLVAVFNQMQDSGDLQSVIDATFMEGTNVPRKPPAAKEVVANLPVVDLNEEILGKLGHESECAVCRENLVVGDKMQELPCKHLFHPPCLKPWLDENNSCPVCRHELRTDDHAYESWKEREKEAEEERRGAANAVRGGEFMYI
ncbi:E3 ubiquitin-protein ligase [Rhynchospora pubera]|uniref:RING-type E3 ubiquitin transferase n=1 Tax=Rhynchospora pubera TaxID=906938 RepID=A0AAV8G8I1_9POAL|nr:E3 ubiquitin-protein ligase [Rhynchospora pubera]